nr:PREDICTED: histone-lysine N-methyltransferase SETDB2 [Lepisosteus oculatus]XP_015219815.1 PREDICTED: histone-lysine N-methyltransferase SETDB2 [Lepisosteus oculatus]XP_015219816.1 PREDICTED: histone-lysine N-methyltransferase SETDB2 [Lepisosteus oculatus]XP_015219817.1 PREDICTED: histone-lysine N-methyltransferase SETDB2 [Lepisosteus oculatus]XP_015219818.1 PREDICTED: histone-lysine N-methyltransferase SETDB2 [Lepisosteus oculatus]XP_015219820.1 PREDICTED: histone-lysine N-methyltransferase
MNSLSLGKCLGEDPTSEVEKAKIFWSKLQTRNQVDHAFDLLNTYLKSLKEGIKDQSATNQEYVRAMNIMLEVGMRNCFIKEHDTFEEIILSAETAVAEEKSDLWNSKEDLDCENVADDTSLDDQRNQENGPCSGVSAPPGELPVPGPAGARAFLPHDCHRACLPCRPLTDEQLRGQDPLGIPALCHFHRLSARRTRGPGEGEPTFDVSYRAPCGRTLRGFGEVARFLREAECDFLHLDYFSFSPAVEVRRGLALGEPLVFERDLSRGAELVAVQLYNDADEAKPEAFRYRKDRWPYGCFIGDPGALFVDCCDCTDGCTDTTKCACLKLSLKAKNGEKAKTQLYTNKRLLRPIPSGIYECGPWCACDRRRCLNRVVQHGLRVKLQVFRTLDRGWGVRCLHDLDQGTFVCTYAGKILRKDPAPGSGPEAMRGNGQEEERRDAPQSSGKRKRGEPPSDDDVEVVEETREEQRAAEDPSLLGSLNEKSAPCAKLSPQSPAIRRPVSKTALLHVQLDKMVKENSFTIPYSSSDEEDLREKSKERVRIPASAETTDWPQVKALAEQAAEALGVPNRVEGGALRGEDSRTPHQAQSEEEGDVNSLGTWSVGEDSNDEGMPSKARAAQKVEKGQKNTHEFTYYLDATEEGNVGRFLNHSCCPNLFVQSVFTDSHNKNFPCVAFFTKGYVKAGTELTWNYTCRTGSTPNQDNPCQCELKMGQNTLA